MALVPATAQKDEDAALKEELRALVAFKGSSKEGIDAVFDGIPVEHLATALALNLGPNGESALHLAAWEGHLDAVQELLRRGAEPDVLDRSGRTPLQLGSLSGHREVALALLEGKADVNKQDNEGETALHKAVISESLEVLTFLLDEGSADPKLATKGFVTPALLAAERGAVEALQALLSRCPELSNVHNESGWTPLHLAAHGIQDRRKVTSAKPAKFGAAVRALLEARADLEARDECSKTPLHRAAAAGNTELVVALAEAGARVSVGDISSWTPLHYACQDGHLQVIKALLSARAVVEIESPPCLTPLAVATMENQVAVAELLVKHKADPNARGKGVASPLMIARKDKDKHSDILALFELGFVHLAA